MSLRLFLFCQIIYLFGSVTFTTPVLSYPNRVFFFFGGGQRVEEAKWKVEWIKSEQIPKKGVEICEGKTRVGGKYHKRSRAVAIEIANAAILAMIEAKKIENKHGKGYFRLTPIKLPFNSTLSSLAVFMAMKEVITGEKDDEDTVYIGDITLRGDVSTSQPDLKILESELIHKYKKIVVGKNIESEGISLDDVKDKVSYIDHAHPNAKNAISYAESVGISFSFGRNYPGQVHLIMAIKLKGKGLEIIGHDHTEGVGGIRYILEKSVNSYDPNILRNNKIVVAFQEPVTGPSFTLSMFAAVIALSKGCKVQPWPMTGLAPVFCPLNLEEVSQLKNDKLFCVLYCHGKGKVASDNEFDKMVVWEGNAADLKDYDIELIKIPYESFRARLRGEITKEDLQSKFTQQFLENVLTKGEIENKDKEIWDTAMLEHDKMGLWKPIQNNIAVQIAYNLYLVTLFPVILVLDLIPNLIGYITKWCNCPCSQGLINFTCESFVLFTTLFLVIFPIYVVSFVAHKVVECAFDLLKIPFQLAWITLSWLIMWFVPWFSSAEFALVYKPYSKMAFDQFWGFILHLTAPFKWLHRTSSEGLEWVRYFQRIETQEREQYQSS